MKGVGGWGELSVGGLRGGKGEREKYMKGEQSKDRERKG